MSRKLNILFVEDSDEDALLIQRELRRGGYDISFMRVDNGPALRSALEQRKWDMVITDYVLPQYSGIKAIQLIRELMPDLPCIMISGKTGEEFAVEAMQAGASDFIIKGHLSRLLPALERELAESAMRYENKLMEQILREKDRQYQALFTEMISGFALHELIFDDSGIPKDYRVLEVNPAYELHTGVKASEIVGKRASEYLRAEDNTNLKRYSEVALTGKPTAFETYSLTFGRYFEIRAFALGNDKFAILFNDISERKMSEKNQRLTLEIFGILNYPQQRSQLIEKILSKIKEHTGIEAAGIRLRRDQDFPFFSTFGFSEQFLENTSTLCLTDTKGQPLRDDSGNTELHCICGSIIKGTNNQHLKNFTDYGSFFMNSISEFETFKPLLNLPGRFHGFCMKAGFESIAIIPLRIGHEVIGVLQLNDHRKNRFSLEQIHFFEGIAGSVGVAIKRVADEDKIRHNEARLKSVLKLSQLKYKSESELFDFALSEATLLSQSEAGYLFSVNDRAGELCVLSHSGVKREIKDEQSAIFPMIQDSINAKRPMIINHFGGNSLSGEENGTPHLRRLLVIPLISDDKVVTVICLKNRREPYTDMDITQVSLLMEVVSKMRDQDRAAKKEQEHYMALDVLSKSAMDFIKYKSQEEIFELIIEKLSLLADCRQVMTISFDPFQKNFRMEKLSGFPAEHMLDLSESAGKDILSMRFRIPLHYLRSLSGGQIVRSEKNFSEFLLPLNGISLVELDRQLSGKNIYLVGLSDNDQVFGAVAFFTEKNVTLNHPLLETFFRQASVALKKSNIISELKKSESRFTSLFEQNNDIVFTLNHREMLTSINPIGEKLITGKFEPGIKIGQFLAPDSYRKLHHTFLETIRMRQNYCAGEMEVYTRNGKLLTFQAGFSLTYIGNKLYEIFGIARNITENKMLQNQVLSKIIETEEKEKKAFAEELHDGLGSLLSTINIYVGLLRKKEKSEADRDVYLKELHNLVNDAVANVRNYANSLTPNVLNDFGLISAVTLFGEKINTTQPGLVTFDFPATEITISRIIEINIYRILLELMNNSMKYSNANSIRISIHEDGAHLRVSYSDNGKGFDLEKVLTSEVSGMGIKNIYTRVSSLNGTCELYSQNGKGVRVEISIPIIPELHN